MMRNFTFQAENRARLRLTRVLISTLCVAVFGLFPEFALSAPQAVSLSAPSNLINTIVSRPVEPGPPDPHLPIVELMDEDFESSISDWLVDIGNTGPISLSNWDTTDFRSDAGSFSAGCASDGDDAPAPGGDYPINMETWMIRGPFDLSDAVSGTLSFRAWLQSETDSDWLSWTVSIDGTNFNGLQDSGGAADWVDYSLDLEQAAVTGQSNVWIAFVFSSDDNTAGTGEGAYIDEILLQVEQAPDIRVAPWHVEIDEAWEIPTEPPEAPAGDYSFAQTVQQRDSISSELVARSESTGMVRVIVGIDTPFQLAGRLNDFAAQEQIERIYFEQDQLRTALAGQNVVELHRYRHIPFMVFEADSLALQELAALPQVISIEEDIAVPPDMASSNPIIGSPTAWAEGYDGTGQVVAVLDTGVAKSHPWFATTGKVISEACYSSNGSSTSFCPGGAVSSTANGSGVNCPSNVDGCDHGTHVAGIVAGNDENGPNYGVARGADIIAIQVFSRFDSSLDCSGPVPCALSYASNQVAALERVFELRDTYNIAAVNMSLGGGRYTDQADCDGANMSRKIAIDQLRDVGIAVVISSGNSGYTDAMGAPACVSGAISVAATNDSDFLESFSNVASFLDLLAPGVSITSSIPGGGTDTKDGTSMASPHVAGAWAVMKQKSPSADVDTLLAAFKGTGASVDDDRIAGSVTDMRRINLDLALSIMQSRSFIIFNDGNTQLDVSAVTLDIASPWLSWTPLPPFSVLAGDHQAVTVEVDWDLAPEGETLRQLSIGSNDPDENPFPDGVDLTIKSAVPAPEFYSSPAANATIDFGAMLLNVASAPQVIQVNNLGKAELTISCGLSGSDADMFTVTQCPGTLPPSSADSIALTCTPTSGGNVTASLDLTTNDLDEGSVSFTLVCIGLAPEFNSMPEASATIDLGGVPLGATSEAGSVKVDNQGNSNLGISCALSGVHSSKFSIEQCPTQVSPGGMGEVLVTCSPSAIGAVTAGLDLTTNDADESAVSYVLACRGGLSEFDPDQAPGAVFEFGGVAIGAGSSPQNLQIRNLGDATLTINCAIGGADADQFAFTQCPDAIPEAGASQISVTCSPTSLGNKTASLDLITNDVDEGSVSYVLSCEGVSPEFQSSPVGGTTFQLGDTAVGSSSNPVTVEVSNQGVSHLTIACALSGPQAPDFVITQCMSPVAPGGSVEVTVICTPSVTGAMTASLDLTTNDADEGFVSYGLRCKGTGPEFDSTPESGSTIDFGGVVTGTGRATRMVQLNNLGDADLTISCALSGSDSADFIINACPEIIPPEDSGNLSLNCEPGLSGARTAALELVTNDPDEGSISYVLNCTGLSPLLINEVGTGEDYVELFNASPDSINIDKLFLQATGCGQVEYGLTSFELASGGYLRIAEIDCWSSGDAGSVALFDIDTAQAVDFVRWGGSTTPPPAGTFWEGETVAPPSDKQAIGRNAASLDTNMGSDWCVQNPSWDTVNLECVAGTELKNLSTRADVGVAHDIAIGGFIISGSEQKCVVIRGRGPSLNVSGVPLLLNPSLALYSGQNIIAENDDWQDQADPNDRIVIEDLGLAPADLRDTAIYDCLEEGAYTALLRGDNGGTGVGIVEVFDADEGSSILKNISTRAHVGTGPLVTIAGFIIEGTAAKKILVRGRGPTVGVPDGVERLSNPNLRLYQLLPDNSSVLLMENDNWGSAANAAEVSDSGQAPGEPIEAAILMTLEPGVYTGILDGVFGTTGTGIIEVIDLTDE